MALATRDAPPVIDFGAFINEQVERNAGYAVKGKGRHRLFVGQTQTGKTTLARIVNRMKKTVLMLGTKPRDESLDRYISEGYVRIDHWPPTKKELRQRGPYEQVKLLLWPTLTRYEDLAKFRPLYREALRDVSMQPYWTVSIDEGFYVCKRGTTGLDLGDEVSEIAYGGASNGTSLHFTIQRPSGVPRIIHQSCHEVYLFKIGSTDDIRELASYSAHTSREVADAVKCLNAARPGGHQFLYLPFAGAHPWEVSEVPAGWA